jgi:hypothetical protein
MCQSSTITSGGAWAARRSSAWVAGDEAVDDGTDGRSLLDEIAREGARHMLLAALETEVAAYLEALPPYMRRSQEGVIRVAR